MEFNKKEMDITFEKLFKYSVVAINQRRGSSKIRVNFSYKKRIFGYIKTIFDLDPELNLNTFILEIVNKKHTPLACKNNVLKWLYLFIFKTEINNNEDIKNQVDSIINLIKKIDNEDLPLPKKYLTEKFKILKKIKLVKVKNEDLSEQLERELAKFKNDTELDIKSTEKIINLIINEYMKTYLTDEEKSKKIESFCQALTSKLNNPENKNDTQKLYNFTIRIIPKLRILYESTGVETDYKNIKACLSLCRSLRNKSRPESEQFKEIEKRRKMKTHNMESLKDFLEIQKLTIDEANKVIKQAGNENIKEIKLEELPKLINCEKFISKNLDKNKSKNLDEEIFNSYVEETRNETKKIISERLKQSSYSTKAPSSQKVLSEILDLF